MEHFRKIHLPPSGCPKVEFFVIVLLCTQIDPKLKLSLSFVQYSMSGLRPSRLTGMSELCNQRIALHIGACAKEALDLDPCEICNLPSADLLCYLLCEATHLLSLFSRTAFEMDGGNNEAAISNRLIQASRGGSIIQGQAA